MAAVGYGGQPHSPVFGSRAPLTAELPLEGVSGRPTIDQSCQSSALGGSSRVQLPESELMQIIYNLEQERETYLEAVAVLHEQLQESQEHYQQLADSHQQIARNLEAEVAEGWKEAERWEAKYHSINQTIREIGLDLCGLQKHLVQQPRVVSSPLPSKPTIRVQSLNSDACTVVTKGDLEHDFPGESNTARRRGAWIYTMNPLLSHDASDDDKGGPNGLPPGKYGISDAIITPGSVAEAIRRFNALHASYIRDNFEPSRDYTPRTYPTFRSGPRDTRSFIGHGTVDEYGNPIMDDDAAMARLYRRRGFRAGFAQGENGMNDHICADGIHEAGEPCPCLSSRGKLCEHCEASNLAVDTFWFTEPSEAERFGWIYLRSPRRVGGPYKTKKKEESKGETWKTLYLVLDATSF